MNDRYNIKVLMADNDDYVSPKALYSKISFNKRLRLIDMVENKKYSIYKASRQLAISNSTAKLIIKSYREEGRIFQKKEQRLKPRNRERISGCLDLKDETIVKKEDIEAVQVKEETYSGDFAKLLTDIIQLNLNWLGLQWQAFERGLQ